jgi:hypothetical protein
MKNELRYFLTHSLPFTMKSNCAINYTLSELPKEEKAVKTFVLAPVIIVFIMVYTATLILNLNVMLRSFTLIGRHQIGMVMAMVLLAIFGKPIADYMLRYVCGMWRINSKIYTGIPQQAENEAKPRFSAGIRGNLKK